MKKTIIIIWLLCGFSILIQAQLITRANGFYKSTTLTTPPSTLLTGLTAAYDCAELSGTIYDLAGGHNSTACTAAYSNPGLTFDNAADMVTLSNSSIWNVTYSGSITISAWVNFASFTPTSCMIFGNRDIGAVFYMYNDAGEHFMTWWPEGTAPESNALTLSTSTWYHFMMVKSGATVTFYQNNTAVGGGSEDTYTTVSPGSVYIGGAPVSGKYFAGTLKKVRYWNKALSSAERTELYTKESAGQTYPWL